MARIKAPSPPERAPWGNGFEEVSIPGPAQQRAYFHQSRKSAPLVVSLHTWIGDFTEVDPIAELVRSEGWSYLHPDFQGPNRAPEACLSSRALEDIDDAIAFGLTQGADPDNVFVVGVSGGGYAALGAYVRSAHRVKAFLSWAPIADLEAWYHQSRAQRNGYVDQLLACTRSGLTLDLAHAAERSPLRWPIPTQPRGRLEIFAGIDDGYVGSVPVTHAIAFFNRVARHTGFADAAVREDEILALASRAVDPKPGLGTIEGREVLFRSEAPPVSLVIFAGHHELLARHAVERIRLLVHTSTSGGGSGQ